MYRFLLLLTLCPSLLYGQLNESFSDGEILNNPVWNGQVNNFIVNSDLSLQLNDSGAGSSFIYTSCNSIENAVWRFSVSLDFNPSSYNYARVYLAMDNNDVEASQNAIYIDVGKTNDQVQLIVLSDGEQFTLAESDEGVLDVEPIAVELEVTVNDGLWKLSYDIGQGVIEVEGIQAKAHFSSSVFGIYCHYTKTRADKFQFDNISVSGEPFIFFFICSSPSAPAGFICPSMLFRACPLVVRAKVLYWHL